MGKAVLVVALLALVIYVLLRLLEKRRAARRPSPQPPRSPGTRRAIAPDDDADFLRDLDFRRRRGKKDQPKDEPRGDADS